MPLLKRVTEPVYVSRGILPEDVRENGRETATLRRSVPNELECVTNGTLASVVRQLSSLSKQAENLFGELHVEVCSLVRRSSAVQGRIDRLAVKVTQLDSNVEEVSLHDIHMRKAFKSSTNFDQQVLSRDTIPTAMLETYEQCDKPPPLDKLNPYREDGKDGLKFYTDPKYFFDLWRQEMLKDTERIMHDKGKKPHRPRTDGKRVNRKVRQPHNTREMYLQKVANQEFLDGSQQQYGGPYVMDDQQQQQRHHVNHYGQRQQQQQPPLRPNSLELHSNYSSSADIYGRTMIVAGAVGAIGSGSPTSHYAAQQQQQQVLPPPAYVEHPQYTQYQPPPPYTPTPPDAHMHQHQHHTPTRQISRTASNVRPSHPPPAPPPGASGSGGSTPSHSAGTPSGARSRPSATALNQRDGLPPPPPPPPTELTNGPVGPTGGVQHYALQKMGSLNQGRTSIPGSPGGSLHESTPPSLSQQSNNTPDSVDLPPPPPTPDKGEFIKCGSSEDQMPSPPPPIASSTNSTPSMGGGFQDGAPTVAAAAAAAPPPPPPPPPMPTALVANGRVSSSPVVTNGDVGRSLSAITSADVVDVGKSLKMVDPKSTSRAQPQPIYDPRSDLLAAIREGIKLRKVEDNKAKEVEKQTAPHDVASILARRVAMEFSDSDTASESEYDSDVWDDDASN